MPFNARAARLLIAGLALGVFAWPLSTVAMVVTSPLAKGIVLSPLLLLGAYGCWEARCLVLEDRQTVSRMAEHADELVAGMETARKLTGVESEPEPELIANATIEARGMGLHLYVLRELNSEGVIEAFLVLETGRGPVKRCPAMMDEDHQTWEDVVASLLGRR